MAVRYQLVDLEDRAMESTDTKVLCLVCAEAIPDEADKAMCGRCKTPYHLKCWNYAGNCSVYACGNAGVSAEKKAVEGKQATLPLLPPLLVPAHNPPVARDAGDKEIDFGTSIFGVITALSMLLLIAHLVIHYIPEASSILSAGICIMIFGYVASRVIQEGKKYDNY